jgi:hypothetical protein
MFLWLNETFSAFFGKFPNTYDNSSKVKKRREMKSGSNRRGEISAVNATTQKI